MQDQFKRTKERSQGLPVADFNPSIEIESRAELQTAELGILPMRQLDDRLQLTSALAAQLYDFRKQEFVVHTLPELLRTKLYAIIQGWADQDDIDQLRKDGAFRLGVSERSGQAPLNPPKEKCAPDGLSSQPTQSRLMTMLSCEHNRKILNEALMDWALETFSIRNIDFPKDLTVDIDSSMQKVFGQPAGTDYNGHYGCSGYHPQFAYLYDARAWIGAELRMGSEHSATGAKEFLLPILSRLETLTERSLRVRGDAAYPEEDILQALENRQNKAGVSAPIPYCFRLKTNRALYSLVAPYLTLPPGRPPHQPRSWVHELSYKAKAWSRERRIVLVVKENQEQLFPDYFLLVTSFSKAEMSGNDVWSFYRQRGTMEADFGQLKATLDLHLSSSDRSPKEKQAARTEQEQFEADQKEAFSNEATLLMFLLAYNMMVMGCHLMMQVCPEMDEAQSGHVFDPHREHLQPKDRRHGWSLQRFRDRVLKCAGRFLLGGKRIRIIISIHSSEIWQRFWIAVTSLQPRLL